MMGLIRYWERHVVPSLRATFGRSERGASLVEYALLLALIAVVCIAAVTLLGGNAKNKFSSVGSELQ
jgi:pilus assembly protein Flp/PilA